MANFFFFLLHFQQGGAVMAIDPVCKMEVDEKRSKFRSEYEGRNYYFCSEECKQEFEEDPEEYVV